MSPEPLLLSRSSFVPLFPFTHKTLTLSLIPPNRSSPISCRSSNPSTLAVPEGTGAAAPTRGDLFLDRHNSKSTAKVVLKERRKKKKRPETKASTSVACCYGCGAPLQTVELDAPGYVDLETYDLVRFS